jgi:hypothetical protein
VSCPGNRTEDVLVRVGDAVLVVEGDDVVREERPGPRGLGVVCQGGDGDEEGGEDVEEAFLLGAVRGRSFLRSLGGRGTYDWSSPC